MKTEQHRTHIVDIRLDALSPTEWRVCDQRVAESNYLSILGFIELRNGHFEVTRMSSPGDRVMFDTLGAAQATFAEFESARIHTGNSVV